MIKRQLQSMLVLRSDLNELQQSAVGEDPVPVLPVMKLKHGVKVEIIEVVQGELICPSAGMTEIASSTSTTTAIVASTETARWKAFFRSSMAESLKKMVLDLCAVFGVEMRW